jgi:hypothetical protein
VPFLTAAVLLFLAAAAVLLMYLNYPAQVLRAAPVISILTLLTTAFIGFMAALWASKRSAESARETAKVIEAYKNVIQKSWDKGYISARTKFVEAYRQGKDLRSYATFDKLNYQEDRETREAINSIANDHEITAIAIERNIIDEDFYRDWFLSTYVQDFDILQSYIDEIRTQTGVRALYEKFETLATRWKVEKSASRK